jgi:hypothetical protein
MCLVSNVTHSDEKGCDRNGRDFGWEIAHAAEGYTNSAHVWMCASFKGHFPSPTPYDSQLFRRCMTLCNHPSKHHLPPMQPPRCVSSQGRRACCPP